MELFGELGRAAEKSQRFFSRHLQYVMDCFPAIANGEDVRFESLSVAGLARRVDIFEEIHLEFFDPAPFAPVAPAPTGIDGETARREPAPERIALGGEERANLIERFQVGDRI